MRLQGKHSSRATFLDIVVGNINRLHIINEVLEVVSVSHNAILIPVFLLDLLLNLFGLADLRGFFDFELAVIANKFSRLAALSQNAVKRFAVKNA